MIGKCSSTVSKQLADQLLNDGIGYPIGQESPKRIYNLHDAVVYEAVYSGDSWHGYPWRYRPGRRSLPRQIQQELERRAERQDCLPSHKQWMVALRNYGASARCCRSSVRMNLLSLVSRRFRQTCDYWRGAVRSNSLNSVLMKTYTSRTMRRGQEAAELKGLNLNLSALQLVNIDRQAIS